MEQFEEVRSTVREGPLFIYDVIDYGLKFLTAYGWYVLAFVIVSAVLWSRLQDFLDAWYEKRERLAYDERCKKDLDWVSARQEGLEASRQKFQEEQMKKSQAYLIKKELEEEKKRAKLLAKYGVAQRLGDGSEAGTSKSFKPEYNPLMGQSSTGYRPARKKACPGGGCG